MPTRVEQFLSHLDRLSGGIEPRFFPVESSRPGLPGVTAIVYDDIPEPGTLTGITYGVSLADHPHWRFGRPELCISVKSDDGGRVGQYPRRGQREVLHPRCHRFRGGAGTAR